jgi:energy-coupling factor transport system ATP-binding protein
MQGTPREIFSRVGELRALQLDVPQTTDLAYRLHQRKADFPGDLLTVPETVDTIFKFAQREEAAA